jgi:hypothetical protein
VPASADCIAFVSISWPDSCIIPKVEHGGFQMSIRILTKRASGQETDELYETVAAGEKSLGNMLNLHRTVGHTIAQIGDVYTITDRHGAFVERIERVPSV